MLDVINRYLHGFVAIPVILACRKKGIFELLQHHDRLSLEEIFEPLGANGGHLQVALRMMRSLNWLEQNDIGQYSLTHEAEIHKVIPEEILDLYHLPIESYLMGEQQSGLLKDWIDRSRRQWNLDDLMIADFLDGILVIPILLALHKHNLFVEDEHKPLFSQLSDFVREELYELFTSKGWARQKEGCFCLTDVGRFIVERVLITGTTASYTPMLSRMTDVLFGDCQAVFRRDASGQESHVARTLNVVASGFQHEKYFADLEDIILSIFNRLPIEEQPKYVVDMGCGDGTLLKRVYETIQSKSARGKVLQQYPLCAIGVDYNEASINATARTLADIPHLVLKGDIGDPEEMIASLKGHGIDDSENILHIRSFLDHDRPFIPPQHSDKVQARFELPYEGVYVAPNGEPIPPHVMVQSLVEHLERWSRVVTRQGLIILEVHCLEPNVVNRFLDKSENLHFDASQGFSMQHLVEADVFLMAAAEVGLFPKFEFSKRYPKIFPFTRITLNCFEKRLYRIRHPLVSDLDALVNLEAKCWSEQLRASSDEIRQRIEHFPNGQCVLEMDSQVVGVIYSQRISSTEQLNNSTYQKVSSLHTKLGPIIQLLAINILPEMQDRGLSEKLREFMLHLCALKGGIESVVGVTRCKNYVNHAHIPIEKYIRQHNELGQLLDPILRFHQQGGATIKGIIPNYRPEDVDNLGNGILIEYDIHNRLQSHSPIAVKVEPVQERLEIELKENETLDDVIEGCIRFVLGSRRRAAFAPKRPLMEMGLDSLELLELRALLSQRLGVELEPTFFFQYGTKDAIAGYFKGSSGEDVRTLPNVEDLGKSGRHDSEQLEIIHESEDLIAIIGMSCRFPGDINSPEQYWSVLRNGIDTIAEVPQDRWEHERYYDPDPEKPGKISSKYGGFLDQVDKFDAQFFRISPREAVSIDPQQRILLEETWIALENAGINPESLAGTQTGVFVGIFSHDYELLQVKYNSPDDFNAYFGTGNSASIAAGRLSYFFGFTGPALAVDTACSSSLVAVHLASHSLLRGECDLAVASGVNLLLSPELSITFSQAGMLSPDGRCKTFDAGANGYVRSEGCAVVVLKRLKKALADRDNILAVIRGTAINQDGTSSGLTAPNELSQSAVIQKALSMAKVSPNEVSYVEAHGTGTSLGDPIEVNALKAVYGQERDWDDPLIIGSVKTNIGHTEATSGIAGLIKVVLSMQNKYIPPHLHFKQLNPHITLDGIPAVIATVGMEWKRPQSGRRLAGVSSFGFSGTNAHVVLEEPPVGARGRANFDRSHHLLTLSAKSNIALLELGQSYENLLATNPESSLADICFTANVGRSDFEYRLAVVADSNLQLRDELTAFATGKETFRLVRGRVNSTKHPKIASLFTGQGSQYIGMGRQLYELSPTFRQTLDRCDSIVRPYLDEPLLSVLYPEPGKISPINETAYTQPALFAIEYALFQLWQSWGIEPNVVMGHSVGEYVAACVAGVFSLEDGLQLIFHRGQLMQQLSAGEMVSLMATEEMIREVIAPYHQTVAIAAINGPQSVVISGASKDIAAICQQVSIKGVKTKRLQVSHAFHSPLMAPMLEEFEQVASQITYNQPQIPLISNVTGQLAGENITNAQYWVNHVRQTVRFADSMQTLRTLGYEVFLEIGPRPILLGMGRECLKDSVSLWLSSLRPGVPEWQQLLSSLGELYVAGMAVDWSGFDRDYFRQKVTLPTYPFQRQPYWIENISHLHQRQQNSTKLHPLLDKKLQLPLSKEILFETEFSTQNLPFLVDHQVYNQIVVAGACHLSLLLGAAGLTFASESCVLENMVFPQALAIPEDRARTVQLVLSPEDSGASFQLISFDTVANGSSLINQWLIHATGKILKGVNTTPEIVFLQQIQTRCTQQIAAVEIYQSWQKRQIQFGTSFQWHDSVWCGDGEALAKFKWVSVDRLEEYQLYPGLLDSCLQLASIFFCDDDTFVPFAIKSFQFYQRPRRQQLWCHVVLSRSDNFQKDNLITDIKLFESTGQLIAEIKGFDLKKVTPNTLLQSFQQDFKENSLENWLYEIEWQPQVRFSREQLSLNYLPALEEISRKVQPQYSHLIAEPQLKVYEAVFSELEALSIDYVLQALRAMGWELRLGQCLTTAAIANQLGVVNQHQRLLKRLLEMLAEVGVLEAKAFDWQVIRQPEDSDPQAKLKALLTQYPIANAEFTLLGRCGASLSQVLRGECDPLQLLFPENDSTTAQLYENSPLIKVMNVIAEQALASIVEHLPTGRGLRILEIGAGTGGTTSYLLPHLPCEQTQYYFSDIGIFFTQKAQEKFQDFPFVKYQVLDIEKDPFSQGFDLQQYDIIVAANVLHATQDLQQTLNHIKQLLAPQGILILLEMTQRQRWLDLIFGLTPGWWRFSDLQLRPDYPLISPTQWQEVLQETGFTSTVNLSSAQQTESVLSLAMVMLAQVPPSPNESQQVEPKHWLLFADQLGIAQQLAAKLDTHSQVCTLVFVGEEYEQLDQRRFKVNPSDPQDYQKLLQVINSKTLPLYGIVHCWSLDTVKAAELTASNLATTSLLGCGSTLHLVQALTGVNLLDHPRLWLVTQGAVAITNLEGVAQSSLWGMARVIAREHPELNCVRIDLAPTADAEVVQALFEEIWFPTTEDQVAFTDQLRYVARLAPYQKSKDYIQAAYKPLRFCEDSTYLITGGMGGLGLLVARGMVQQGARHLVLVGRSAASVAVDEQLQELEQAGAQIKVAQADVSDVKQITRVLREIEQTLPPLRGIIHSVGVLDDGVLQQLNWQRFVKVLAPKVQGAWHLHTLTQNQPLDFFVMFSSIASLLGNPGQSNHAAANAFLDALAYYRQAQGLAGLSINWGPWSQVGAFAQRQLDEQTKTRGIGTFAPEQGLVALEQLLSQSSTQVAVMPVNWVQFFEKSTSVSPLFTNFLQTPVKTVVVQSNLVEQLKTTDITKRRKLLEDHICSIVAKVLSWDLSEPISVKKGFFELGMDSLTSLDLKNHLQKSLKCSLPLNLVFEYPNIEMLTDYLVQELNINSDESEQEVPQESHKLNIENSNRIKIEL